MTGAGRGIGAACATRLAADGFDIALTYASDDAAAQATAERVRQAGRRAAVYRFEARADDPHALLAAIERDLGPSAAAILNAGLTRDRPAVRMEPEDWRAVLDVNLTGTVRIAEATIARMAPRGAGSVVTIGSIVGRTGNAGQVNYATAKAGLVGAMRALARAAGPAGVRVNVVAPGYIRTRLTEVLDDRLRDRLLAATPLGRLGEPADVAGPVSFLCSPAAGFVTGTVLAVDGGLAF